VIFTALQEQLGSSSRRSADRRSSWLSTASTGHRRI